ncbi:dipeptidase [Chlamydiifrater volucris]|uniref:dipeptidase n=1 Tax=Chlamydiifrater volucris TaxID=2681470 RepID=UPI001BD034A2|nr:membrane dipeptidase [Chlamydiifrater volucris]
MIISDLHCDLLSLPSLTGNNLALRCTPQQLMEGNVGLQVCALFTKTSSESVKKLKKQNDLFFSLPEKFPFIEHLHTYNASRLPKKDSFINRVLIIRSIENASGIAYEKESMQNVIARLELLLAQGPLAYVSLVWNFSNRFGGGILEPKPLTNDGKTLLQELDRLSIPVDLSHASGKLTEDILDYAANKLPTLMTIASHSNFFSVHNHPRNLQDDHAKEIANRGGVIGLCMVKDFIGQNFQSLAKHLQKATDLGIIKHLCLGADFFYSPPHEHRFFPECQNAADYGAIKELICKAVPDITLQTDIMCNTAKSFLQRVLEKGRRF